MKKTLLIIVISAVFAAIAAGSPTIRVTSYPLTVVDAKTGTVNVLWDDNAGGVPSFTASLIYGTKSGVYPVSNHIPEDSAGTLSFIPFADEGMTGGVYYFRVSNDADSTWSNEYTLHIGKNAGLVLNDIKLSPNPFSPNLGVPKGLNISYTPESDNKTNVKVTIKAFTVAGRLIRTILPGAMRTVGIASIDDFWDGKDDEGRMARNGRYIIQCEVEDTTGKKQYLNTVILVK